MFVLHHESAARGAREKLASSAVAHSISREDLTRTRRVVVRRRPGGEIKGVGGDGLLSFQVDLGLWPLSGSSCLTGNHVLDHLWKRFSSG